ncbi:aminoacetone oxidase family FAD-binding enzyme [Campylobacter sp. VBCF_07 NA4]|uniref:NAD(P)/FAD-dependent oxidoreductase n=1 Tax=Campylobacter sp. VBCF_07 NA4 TaxID=2983835 RepID=UPI0022E9D8F3|nr:aminoacetone oxidase family FAD-binding enzyme [Campylobacter sp. VBCF_07 NA4]MDA3055212.1 aminoacetone oxidase family FAD-binding enzyme [Campylobacter sp. VBCF_07 NA4]
MIYDAVIVGAGAAGLFSAINLRAKSVLIVEKNALAGRKILASGGGRCNITNANLSAKNYLGDENFISQILRQLSVDELLSVFAPLEFGLEKNAQYFCKNHSRAVLQKLLSMAQKSCEIRTNCEICEISKSGEIFNVLSSKGEKFCAKNLIIATGGPSFRALGASDSALSFAVSFGIKCEKFRPALVGLCVQKSEFWFKNLSGVSLGVRAKLAGRDITGEALFTHRGISGPAILNASLFWRSGKITLNFAPNHNMQSLEKALNGGKKQLSSLPFLPKRFVLEFLRSQNLQDKIFSKYSHAELEKIARIFSYEFAPAGTFGFEKAEISAGGVCADELGADCESKKIPGLYFAGECIDASGMLGGYNLHFAFASALCVARAINSKLSARNLTNFKIRQILQI